ncbi:MAG: UDP-3-O-(3-hydroxymyristoyl)glucosamine N-acyltransferase [Planctomycetes bacterium]|nr:UDP-3-O-(3-hydroxymyristoyl)glucosamine N-acyltransferase [Planctomycetota bacterium]
MSQRPLREIAELCGAALEGDGERLVRGPADLAQAGPDEVSFLANPRYAPLLERTRAAAVVVARDVPVARADLALLRVDDPNRAFTAVVRAFAPVEAAPPAGVHPTAVVAPGAEVDASASVGPFCALAAGARVAAGAVLHAGVTLGRDATVGERSVLHPNVVLYAGVRVGADCVIHAGAVLGSDGFGFEPTRSGWEKIPQCGVVVVEDEVEVGANCTVDRARFGATVLRRGVKLDNLVQVGHNVEVGPASLLCAQVGIAGSTRLGERVVLGGQVGVGGHLEVAAGTQVGGQGGVTGSTEPGAQLTGTPARPVREVLSDVARVRRLPRLREELRALEARLAALEAEGGSR